VARLILDTGVLIAGVRGRIDVGVLADTDDVAIPAVAVAEYLAGVLLDGDPGRAAAQRAFLDDVLAVVPVHEYDREVAEHHASLLAHVHASGHRRGAHDLIIAATARASDRVVLTTDERARFGELSGVSVRVVPA
jgi:tRNA(fMet)-specific endonuclease VapC